MKVVVRTGGGRLRSTFSFTFSACLHAFVLGWVTLSPLMPRGSSPSLYDQEIRPNQAKIVWYDLKQHLPEISPAEHSRENRPPRARALAPRVLVGGK